MGEREGTMRAASHGQCRWGKLSEDGRLSPLAGKDKEEN